MLVISAFAVVECSTPPKLSGFDVLEFVPLTHERNPLCPLVDIVAVT